MLLSQTPPARLLGALLSIATLPVIINATPTSISIDDSAFIDHFTNQTHVPLRVASNFAGPGWIMYPWFDIQGRIGSYIVPLFLLVGSFQFAPLRFRNTVNSTLHLISDPLGSLSSLLTVLATHQKLYDECQTLEVPEVTKKPIAMVLAAYVDWIATLVLLEDGNDQKNLQAQILKATKETKHTLTHLLRESQDAHLRSARITEIQASAKELSDGRVNGLGKLTIGTVNYLVSLGLAFTRINNGDFNNRTGHSIAFAMLCSWLIVAVFLSSIVGGFKTKRTARTIMERLQRHLHLIEVEEHRQLWVANQIQNQQEKLNPSDIANVAERRIAAKSQQLDFHTMLSPPIFKFHLIAKTKGDFGDVYDSLENAGGMNFSLNPSMLCQGWQKSVLHLSTLLPVSISAATACWFSATNPTDGIGCRSIQQLSFYAAWLVSATITVYFRARFQGSKQVLWTSVKDLFFCLAFGTFFGMGFIGWFNSTFCWSAWFSRGIDAFIVPNPRADIQKLARTIWPEITGSVIAMHLLFILVISACFWNGVCLYAMSDEEHDSWHTIDASEEMNRLERKYSETYPFLSV